MHLRLLDDIFNLEVDTHTMHLRLLGDFLDLEFDPRYMIFGCLLVLCLGLSILERYRRRAPAASSITKPYPSLRAADHVNDGKFHLLLAATGSVATIKIPNILDALSRYDNLSIRLLLSDSAASFLQAQSGEQPSLDQIAKIRNVDAIYRDEDEWRKPWIRGDSILHIELRRWADLMVIAPLSANSLAKVALGFSDNLISSTVRAWDSTGIIDGVRPGVRMLTGDKKIIMVAPAMNTAMWSHPVTAKHLETLTTDWAEWNGGWFEVLRPVEKELACGDTGSGAMRSWTEIVAAIESKLNLSSVTASAAGNGEIS